MEPAAPERLFRGLGLVPIAFAELWRTVEDLPLLAGCHVVAGWVDHAGLDEEHGTTGGPGVRIVLLGSQHGGERAHLRLAERVVEAHARQRLAQSCQDGPGHDGRAVVALREAGEVTCTELVVIGECDPHGGRGEEGCDPLLLEDLEQLGRNAVPER